MGLLNHLWIKKFITGRTIIQVMNGAHNTTYLHFDNGEYLCLAPIMESLKCHCGKPKCSKRDYRPMILATPYKENNEVKQSTEIHKG
jgi:hypothetical protein